MSPQGVESYLDRADLSGVAAASLELIDAADPLRAGHGDAPAAACVKPSGCRLSSFTCFYTILMETPWCCVMAAFLPDRFHEEKTMRSGMETAPISAPEPRTSSSDVLPQPGGTVLVHRGSNSQCKD
jgi:hypothetical protein